MSDRTARTDRLSAVLLAPLQRVADDVPGWGKALALVAGGGQYLAGFPFVIILTILVGAIAGDHVFGSLAAKHQRSYRPLSEHTGLVGKAAGLVVVLILRGLEAWVGSFGAGSTRGALASAVALGLCVVDLKSIERHRKALGAGPIPLLSPVLAWFDAIAAAKIPALPPAPERPPDGAP